jgi:hypothetical protein
VEAATETPIRLSRGLALRNCGRHVRRHRDVLVRPGFQTRHPTVFYDEIDSALPGS